MNQSLLPRWVCLCFLVLGLVDPVMAVEPFAFGDAVEGVRNVPPSANSQTVDITVGPGFSFSKTTVTILVGDTVRWTWAGSNHTVTSGVPCAVDNRYCSPSDATCATAPTSNTNAVYSHTFGQAGTFPYFCRVHCSFGMTGTVKVVVPMIASVTHATNGHFIITGTSVPNASGTVTSSPDLLTAFANPQPITTDANGGFQYDDPGVVGATAKFYQVNF